MTDHAQAASGDVAVLSIGSRRFATGLRWQNLRSSVKYMDEARAFGRENQMDIVAIRVSKVIQAGFVAKARGVDRSMYSAAAVLIDTLGQSWLAAFLLDDGRYYLVAADKDAVIPDTDFVGTEEDALGWARALAGQFGWSEDQLIVPASWAMGGHEESIASVMARAQVKRSHRLKSLPLGLAREEWLRLGAAAVGIAAVFGVGFYFWQQHTARLLESQRAAARVRADEMARLSAEQARMIAKSSLTRPWTLKPLAREFLKTCEQTLYELPLSVGGWVFEGGHCDAASMTATYKRSAGTTNLDYLAEFNKVFPGEHVATTISADETAKFALPVSMTAGGDEYDELRANARDEFVSHFQRVDHKLQVKATQSVSLRPDVLPNGKPWPKDLAPPKPTWRTYTFAFDSAQAPSSVLDGFPPAGLRIESVETRLDAGNATLVWHTNGVIYARQ
ncbi:type 4b pilus protein PilO2 [Castellaniella sp. UC4442_H9]